jgi:hypothetical protein
MDNRLWEHDETECSETNISSIVVGSGFGINEGLGICLGLGLCCSFSFSCGDGFSFGGSCGGFSISSSLSSSGFSLGLCSSSGNGIKLGL